MGLGTMLGWGLVVLGSAVGLYGLHRLMLRLEERGLVYYLHKMPRGGGAGSFVALQKALEPRTQHVLQIREEKRFEESEGVPGPGGAVKWPEVQE
jgi:hypothetical protein